MDILRNDNITNKNWGDKICKYIYNKIINTNISNNTHFFDNIYNYTDHYLTIGSILQHSNKHSIIWGTGFMTYMDLQNFKFKKICSVRGPLTRLLLKSYYINCPDIYGDPALLMPLFYKPSIKKKYTMGIIPHYSQFKVCKKMDINNINYKIINIAEENNEEKFIDDILSCNIILSSSLHGIIVAHAYNIPTVWISINNNVPSGNLFKYFDYFLSVGLTIDEPLYNISNSQDIDALINKINNNIELISKPVINYNKILDSCPFLDKI